MKITEEFKTNQLNSIPDIHAKALHYVFENGMVSDDGLWLEFGVYRGKTINRMAKYTNKPIIFGFDSFEGLPEAWEGRTDGPWVKGCFSLSGLLPEVASNVTLIKGWFSETIPKFVNENKEKIVFIHIDSDIYSSAKQILEGLIHRIPNGCIIVFDELVGYTGYEKHEWKAWWEFIEKYGVEFEWIGGNSSKDWSPDIRVSPYKLFDDDRTDSIQPHNSLSPAWENVGLRITKNPHFIS